MLALLISCFCAVYWPLKKFELLTIPGTDVLILGDFNCDVINLCELPKDGRSLIDFIWCYRNSTSLEPDQQHKTNASLWRCRHTHQWPLVGLYYPANHVIAISIEKKYIFAALKTLIVINLWGISVLSLSIFWKFLMTGMTCVFLKHCATIFPMNTHLCILTAI